MGAAIRFYEYINSDGLLQKIIEKARDITNRIFEIQGHFHGSFKDQEVKNTSHSLLMLFDLIIWFSVSETNHANPYFGSSIALGLVLNYFSTTRVKARVLSNSSGTMQTKIHFWQFTFFRILFQQIYFQEHLWWLLPTEKKFMKIICIIFVVLKGFLTVKSVKCKDLSFW